MHRTRVLLALLVAAAIFSSVAALWLLNTRQGEATHFRPSICLNDKLGVWDVCYTTIDGDGLVALQIFYKNKKVLHRMHIPHVFVDYVGRSDITDNFLDVLSHNCWRNDYTDRFVLVCRYDFGTFPNCGSYRYQEEFHFSSNGVISPKLWIYGPGFNDDHTYRALFYTDFDIDGTASDRFYRWESGAWALKSTEGFYPDDYNNTHGVKSGYEWVNWQPSIGYWIDPRSADGKSSTEGASMWATRYDGLTEGQNGLADVYLNGQSIQDADIVDWYTAYRFNSGCDVPASPYLTGPENLVPGGY